MQDESVNIYWDVANVWQNVVQDTQIDKKVLKCRVFCFSSFHFGRNVVKYSKLRILAIWFCQRNWREKIDAAGNGDHSGRDQRRGISKL